MKKLSRTELKIIDRVIGVCLGASGPDELVKNTGYTLERIENLESKIAELIEKGVEFSPDTFGKYESKELPRIYSEALSLAEKFDDLHTLTGFEEGELYDLKDKLEG